MPSSALHIRPADAADCRAICRIYAHHVRHGIATFDESPPIVSDLQKRLDLAQQAGLPWLVGQIDEALIGYACANPWKAKSAYRFSVETSIYLAPQAQSRGHGRSLYAALLQALDQSTVHQAVACISLPNPRSEALHRRLGFMPCGHFRQVGYKFQRWIDVAYWQRSCGTKRETTGRER